ncbi:hypothetical protein CWI39_0044p0010 [Hamiltosporidium magnivora]|uniref:Uncharacterized protein n=1 Tax=Hamiltosporidium magnivora TaxID=148818 RepID=A0A4V2JWY5_9MICR|nr:hypothetical protein CWI39_0044p0010 [Hamiltosporidium magnivora]
MSRCRNDMEKKCMKSIKYINNDNSSVEGANQDVDNMGFLWLSDNNSTKSPDG